VAGYPPMRGGRRASCLAGRKRSRPWRRSAPAMLPAKCGRRAGCCGRWPELTERPVCTHKRTKLERPGRLALRTGVQVVQAPAALGCGVSANTNYPASDQLVSYTLAWTECFYTTNCVGSQWYAATTDRGISAHLIRSDESHCVGTAPSTDPSLVLSPVHYMSPVPCQLERRS